MKFFKKKYKPSYELTKVLCNKCGHRTDHTIQKDHVSIKVTWGYFSKKDCENHEFDLCEKCYDEIIENFMHKPKITTSF